MRLGVPQGITYEVKRFVLKGKLSPRYVGPYQVMEKVGPIANQVALPTKYEGIQDVFYVSSLWNSFKNQQARVISFVIIPLQPNLTYAERLVQIVEFSKGEGPNSRNARPRWCD